MHISWLGGTGIRIQTKPYDEEVSVIIDPYRPAVGSAPKSLSPQICLYTRGEADSIPIVGQPYILSTPGECETKGVLMTTLYGTDSNHIMVRLDSEQMSIAHLGLTKQTLTNAQLEIVGGVDILFLPIGHKDSYDAEEAVKIVNIIEPRVVIPMAFKSENDPDAAAIEGFLREMGAKTGTREKKVILKKKDLPQEETMIIVLDKE